MYLDSFSGENGLNSIPATLIGCQTDMFYIVYMNGKFTAYVGLSLLRM